MQGRHAGRAAAAKAAFPRAGRLWSVQHDCEAAEGQMYLGRRKPLPSG